VLHEQKDSKESKKPNSLPKETKEPKQNQESELRSPICCILGHVDTGKTKLLDKIRHSKVQEGEAGGITQQIGATYFPLETLIDQTKVIQKTINFRIPGLLVIDTPGHESFTNLRVRGSSLCDIAILVVDIMHGLEQQTLESLMLLKQKKTPFVVALNKVDRLYSWRPIPNAAIQPALKKQNSSVIAEYNQRVKETIVAFAEQGLNAALYYENKDPKSVVSLVPTSAITGEGIPDLLRLLVELTQKMMSKQLLYVSELKCSVLEVKVIEGHGTTIDVVLSNGELHEGDTIVVCGMNGPIVTTIRALLTPHPCKEMRVSQSTAAYVHSKVVRAAQGVKISATDLDKAVAGSSLLVFTPDGPSLETLKREVMIDLQNFLAMVDKSGRGVCVQASTLGSLEALLVFLKESNIPVAAVNLGPIHKKDVVRASVMLEHDKTYAVILAFDVKVEKDAMELADKLGVKIFTADIIYHLFDEFTKYMAEIRRKKQQAALEDAVFPVILKIMPECIFRASNPIIIGVEVVDGVLKNRTPLVAMVEGEQVDLGRVTSIESNHANVESSPKGSQVAIKIERISENDQIKLFGRHFTEKDLLYSKISRLSLDSIKENFREELEANRELIQLLATLKKLFGIQ